MRYFAAALLLMVSPAGGQMVQLNSTHFETVANLRFDCRTLDRQGACISYIQGVIDLMWALPHGERRVCIPDTTTIGELKTHTQAMLANLPEDRDYGNAATVVYAALRSNFPCKP